MKQKKENETAIIQRKQLVERDTLDGWRRVRKRGEEIQETST